jgi:hypothetical protein
MVHEVVSEPFSRKTLLQGVVKHMKAVNNARRLTKAPGFYTERIKELESSNDLTEKEKFDALKELAQPVLTELEYQNADIAVTHYLRELIQIGVWPTHEALTRNSISSLLERLTKFDRTHGNTCTCNYEEIQTVNETIRIVGRYLQGLCVDCMRKDETLRQRETEPDRYDDNYGHFGISDSVYDKKCRIRHKNPTWYWSNMNPYKMEVRK